MAPVTTTRVLSSENGPRIRTVTYWIATLTVASESAIGGLWWDLFLIPYVRDIFDRLEYPLYFAQIMGVWKGLAVLALLAPGFPRLKEWAYAGLVFIFSGAAISHWSAGDGVDTLVWPLLWLAITIVSWALRPPSRRDPAPLPESRTFTRLFAPGNFAPGPDAGSLMSSVPLTAALLTVLVSAVGLASLIWASIWPPT
jgi:hypothetical protein